MTTRRPISFPIVLTGALIVIVASSTWRDRSESLSPAALGRVEGRALSGVEGAAVQIDAPGGPATSREALDQTIQKMEARLASKPTDGSTAVTLAQALLRQARVKSDGALAVRAQQVLETAIRQNPDLYEAQRLLGAVYLSQHRFRQAIASAERARQMRPDDSWNDGVMGDGYIEIGEYEKTFAAFQEMNRRRPSAASYARASYAKELQGDLRGAIDLMRMASDATTAHDPEGQAWHFAQLGHLYMQLGDLKASRREYEHAAFTFPGHPYALAGLAKLDTLEGHLDSALTTYRELFENARTPEVATEIGDILAALGRKEEAERQYELSERLEREGWAVEEPQPGALARMLAERGRKIDEALKLAREAASSRQDIFTLDALAWASWRAGDGASARQAIDKVLALGTVDRKILYHAAAIYEASGDRVRARKLVDRALDGLRSFDLIASSEAAALQKKIGYGRKIASRAG
jgi:tetratricopeptide (TPR) repeat protein